MFLRGKYLLRSPGQFWFGVTGSCGPGVFPNKTRVGFGKSASIALEFAGGGSGCLIQNNMHCQQAAFCSMSTFILSICKHLLIGLVPQLPFNMGQSETPLDLQLLPQQLGQIGRALVKLISLAMGDGTWLPMVCKGH